MKTGIILLNFGEPDPATPDRVTSFLEGIFEANASLERPGPDGTKSRARRLAEERAPSLVEEYRMIGGSPLNRQATAQSEGLGRWLQLHGHDAVTFIGMQFTDPSIASAVAAAREAGVERLVALPVYPLAGPSTTQASIASLHDEVARQRWAVAVHEVPVWHRHPGYVAIRANAVRHFLAEQGLDLYDPATKLVFSAHGTPLKYLEEGSRYLEYVLEFCGSLAEALGVASYAIGYQNHGNRPGVEWTRPDVDDVVQTLEAERVVVEPVSFMHEQSETLAELDHGLRGVAEEAGLSFYRVPIPHDAPAFVELLAELVVPFLDPVGEQAAGDRSDLNGERP